MKIIDRVVHLLEILGETPEGLTLTDAASSAELSVSTAHRILASLGDHRFVYQGADRRYRIGPEVARLAAGFQRQSPLVRIARPYLDSLRTKLNESVFLSERINDDVVCVATAEAPRLLTLFMQLSERAPYHAGASARAVLAYCAPAVQEDLLRRENRAQYTDKTRTGLGPALAALEETRKNGFALCEGELEIGVTALAVPVSQGRGEPLGAITVVAPSDRLDRPVRQQVAEELKLAAEEIAGRLGADSGLDGSGLDGTSAASGGARR